MHKREREHAASCSVTLVTEADWELHDYENPDFLKILGSCRLEPAKAHYDLISIPTFRGLILAPKRIEILIGNIVLAVDVHSSESVWLMHKFSDSSDYVYHRLRREFVLRFPKLSLSACLVPAENSNREPSRRLVVTCMDFRLHHKAGLQGMFTEASAWLTYPGAAFAGVDPATEEIFFADLDRVVDREAVSELTLVSHTDCAKYAAKYSWRNAGEERRQLANDLRAVAGRIRSRYSHLTILCAIAKVEDGAVKQLISVV
ncbi:hypothetical protein HYT45_04435 [Candidatus Uhrbacteria bacterium]|nr:hypothetical protein [Candidatus Uhrbacteria bacterium]